MPPQIFPNMGEYHAMYKESIENADAFWAEQADKCA
jgi:hypothetical protein